MYVPAREHVLTWGKATGGTRFRAVWSVERENGGLRVASGLSACLGSVRSGSCGAAVGHRLLGGGSPAIEYASVTDTIEKAMVYV